MLQVCRQAHAHEVVLKFSVKWMKNRPADLLGLTIMHFFSILTHLPFSNIEYIPLHHLHSQGQKRACLVSGRRNAVPRGTDAGGPLTAHSSQPSHASAASYMK